MTDFSVAVLGAGGTIAPAIVRDLAGSEEVDRLLLLDIDQQRAADVAEAHGGDRASAQAVDATDSGALVTALGGAGLLVNSASYRINLDVMRACLEANCHYLDLGGLYRMTHRQLELGPEFERRGLLALLGIGSSPGKTNLMALHGVRQLGGEQAERIEVMAAGRDLDAPDDGRLRPPYALQTLIDELTLAPVVLRDGNPVEIEPLTAGGVEDFGQPIGSGETIYTLHSELATFGESFGCREASFRLSLSPPLLARLTELAKASDEERAAAAADAARPSAQTVSVHLVRLTGSGGATVLVRAVTRSWSGLGGSIVSTAAPAAAAARLLARGSLTARGVMPPERCIDPDEMFAELEQRGCEFSVATN
jgi:saccharopine dehydrogenase-like NADP-dependent oxidoreductase